MSHHFTLATSKNPACRKIGGALRKDAPAMASALYLGAYLARFFTCKARRIVVWCNF
jgi:hypothetical protein